MKESAVLQSQLLSVTIPKMPADIDVNQMTSNQIHAKLQQGYEEYTENKTMNAADVFKKC